MEPACGSRQEALDVAAATMRIWWVLEAHALCWFITKTHLVNGLGALLGAAASLDSQAAVRVAVHEGHRLVIALLADTTLAQHLQEAGQLVHCSSRGESSRETHTRQ